MAGPAIDDKSVSRAVAVLKTHTIVQRKQMRAESERIEADEDPLTLVEDLDTVQMWAEDSEDDGHAWAAKRDAESNETLAQAQRWKQQVDGDEREAEELARQRANVDVDDVKKEIFAKFDEYRDALKEQADNDQEWAKAKLAEWEAESKKAKETIDEGLEPTLDKIDQRRAGRQRKTKLIAEKMAKRATQATEWRNANAGQPENWPDNQRADVKRALEATGKWAEQTAGQIKPYGAKAGMHVKALGQVKEWTGKQAGQVDGAAGNTAEAKEAALAGVEHARKTHDDLEQFLERQESEANVARGTVDAWVSRNNALAKIWINSTDSKQREWAKAWMDSRGQSASA